MAYAWKCPNCGDVVPGRRNPGVKNIEVRVCMNCVLTHGELHYRERGDELPRARRAAKTLPDPPGLWRGLDLQAECDRLVALEICPQHLRDRPPTVTVRRPPSRTSRLAGCAYPRSRRIHLFATRATSRGCVLATLVHEVAHLWVDHHSHDDYWRMCAVELVREGYGMEPDCPRSDKISDLDECLERALVLWCQQQGLDKP